GVDCGGFDCYPCSVDYWFTNTGMNTTASDYSEDVYGDSWVNGVAVTAGQGYYLMVNNWSPSANGFDVVFTFSEGGAMDCTILPIELLSFNALCRDNETILNWSTASERNNDYFVLLKSYNGITYAAIDTIKGAGNSNQISDYSIAYTDEYDGLIYYKLKQVDFNGNFAYSDVIVKSCSGKPDYIVSPNPVAEGRNWKILGLEENDELVIVDLLGRTYKEKHLPKGVYIIKVNGEYINKLIVR
ncbi:MAG: T9SS type A sorting domain-containing protein, partial [Bacteroidota bacterium]